MGNKLLLIISFKLNSLFLLIFFFSVEGSRDKRAIYNIHPHYNGVREVHMRQRDITTEQCRHNRHGHAHATLKASHHC
jgi:hypothetical protein